MIGHSQGTSQIFAMLSQDKGHSKKVNLYIALSPIVYFDDFDPFKFYPGISTVVNETLVRTTAEAVHETTRLVMISKPNKIKF